MRCAARTAVGPLAFALLGLLSSTVAAAAPATYSVHYSDHAVSAETLSGPGGLYIRASDLAKLLSTSVTVDTSTHTVTFGHATSIAPVTEPSSSSAGSPQATLRLLYTAHNPAPGLCGPPASSFVQGAWGRGKPFIHGFTHYLSGYGAVLHSFFAKYCFYGGGQWDGPAHASGTFLLSQPAVYLEGTFAVDNSSPSASDNVQLRLYSGPHLIWTSPLVNGGSSPYTVKAPINGVSRLTIEFYFPDPQHSANDTILPFLGDPHLVSR